MDAVSESVRRDVPWDVQYEADLIIEEVSPVKLRERFSEWQEALES